MYGAIFSPNIAFNSHGIDTVNSFRTKLRAFPATHCSADEDLERNGHGFSLKRRFPKTPSSLAGNFRAPAAAETLERPLVDTAETPNSEAAIVPALEIDGGSDGVGGGEGHGGRIGGGQADRDDEADSDEREEDDDDGGGGGEELLLTWQLFDGEPVEAVLREWMRKTKKDLPLALKDDCAMGVSSSAEFHRFLWFKRGLITELNGKVMANPLLLYKSGFEALCSVCVDFGSRKNQRTKKDRDLMVTNGVINAICCNLFLVWSLAPCNELINLPRLLCFLHKQAAFFALGFASQICLSNEKISTENLGTLKQGLARICQDFIRVVFEPLVPPDLGA